MERIPVIGFAAFSGTGKTTLVEKLVRNLKAQGLRIAVVKHDAHDFEIDKEGKDSWRFAQAGADVTLISSATKTAVIEYRPSTFMQNLEKIRDVDLILVEGYKQEEFPRIGICRKATGKGLPGAAQDYAALVTDEETYLQDPALRCFALDDVEGVAAFVRQTAGV